MTLRFTFPLVAAIALAAAPAAAKLSPAERKMMSTIDAEQARTLALLERLVNQNSGSQNPDGVAKVAEILRPEFEQLGFNVRTIDMREAGRGPHFVAHHPGKGRKLLLIGHLDTVFEPDSPFQRFERKADWGHGPGAGDDKGGDIVMLSALRAMKAAGMLKNADITVFLTGDEEDSGTPIELARRDLVAAGKAADIALDFEGLSVLDGKDMGVVARRGSMSWTVTSSSKPAHSSGIFSKEAGYGAIYEVARIVDAFRRDLTDDKLTYNVGMIGGGQTAVPDAGKIRLEATGKTNIIAATAIATGDLRALTPEQVERTKAKMSAIVAASLPGTSSKIEFGTDGYPPMAPTAGNRALLARLNAINADIGLAEQQELDPLLRGAGDISFVAADTDGLVGLGPYDEGSHTDQERVDIPSIWRQAKRAAILMSRLAADKR